MIAKKPKYKLSNEVYNKILELVKTLPPLQLVGKDGKPLSRTITKFTGTKDFNMTTGSRKNTYQKGTEPILVNHKLKLIAQFEMYGYVGINNYVAFVEQIVAAQTKEDAKPDEQIKSEK